MPDPESENQNAHDSASPRVPVQVRRQFLDREEDELQIETRPTYVNHLVLIRAGTDVFMDIGIVPADDLVENRQRSYARCFVLDRLVMGLETFVQLHDAVRALYDQLQNSGVLPNEKIITAQPEART